MLSVGPGNAFAGQPFDGGGMVGDYLDVVSAADASAERVEIAGVCASACTIKLGAHNACIHADAQLWFHAARSPDGQINGLATQIMMQQYPGRIRAWVASSRALKSLEFKTMSGAQAISLGVRDCDRSAGSTLSPSASNLDRRTKGAKRKSG
jgi:hypothetical protein